MNNSIVIAYLSRGPEKNKMHVFKDTKLKIVGFMNQIEVNGDNTAPLYKFLKTGKWGIIGDEIQWNFAKFLVNKDGQAVDRYYPTTSPLTIEVSYSSLHKINRFFSLIFFSHFA